MKRILIMLSCMLPLLAVGAEQRFTSIGTGGLTGVYYPTGGAICRLLNRERKTHGIRCSVESTGGSIYNLNALASGELEFGVAQSDMQYHAYEGSSKFSERGANPQLRIGAPLAEFGAAFIGVVLHVRLGHTEFEFTAGQSIQVVDRAAG